MPNLASIRSLMMSLVATFLLAGCATMNQGDSKVKAWSVDNGHANKCTLIQKGNQVRCKPDSIIVYNQLSSAVLRLPPVDQMNFRYYAKDPAFRNVPYFHDVPGRTIVFDFTIKISSFENKWMGICEVTLTKIKDTEYTYQETCKNDTGKVEFTAQSVVRKAGNIQELLSLR